MKLTRGKFDGKFFAGRNVTLTGKNVTGWIVSETSSSGVVTTKEVEGETLTMAMPNAKNLVVTAKVGDTAIEQITDNDSAAAITDIYDASGLRRKGLGEGYNVVRTTDGKTKKIWQSTGSAE